MNALYSLYDALISINVPMERARAVVDALERDMTAVLATKSDLTATQLLLSKDIESSHALLRQELGETRAALQADITGVRDSLRAEIAGVRDSLKTEIAGVRDSLKHEFNSTRIALQQSISAQRESTGQRFDAMLTLMHSERESLQSAMTVRLGSITIVGLGLLFAGLKLML